MPHILPVSMLIYAEVRSLKRSHRGLPDEFGSVRF